MSDQEVVVQFKAVVADFLDKLGQAHKGTADAAEKITSSVNGIGAGFEKLMGTLGALSAVMAGGAMFKEAIKATVEWTGEVVGLAKKMGITTEAASGLAIALHHIGMGSEEYSGLVNKLTMHMRTSGEAFETMGIQTRDTDGNWRNSQEVMMDVIEKLGGLKKGTDLNAAAQELFGGRVGNINTLLKLNADLIEESRQKAEKFHLLVGPDGAAKVRAYKESMKDMELVGKSLNVQMGNELIPTLTELGHFFGEIGPGAAMIFGAIIKGVTTAFYTLKFAVEWTVAAITDFFLKSIEGFKGIGQVVGKLIKGDFAGAVDAVQAANGRMEAITKETTKIQSDLYEDLGETMARIWDDAGKKTSTEDTGKTEPEKKKKEKKPESQMPKYQEELDAQKDAIMVLSDFKKVMGKKAEADYWTGVLEELNVGDADYKAVQSKKVAAEKAMYDERRALAKKDSDENRAMDKADLNEELAIAKDGFTTRRTLIQEEVDAGRMSKEESLRQLMQLKAQELAVEKAAINQEMLDESLSGAQVQALRIKRDATERKAMDDIATYKRQLAQKENLLWVQLGQTIQSSLGNALTSIIMKTQTFGQALQGLFKTVTGSIVQMFVQMGIEQAKQFILSKIQGKAAAVSDITAAAGTYAVNAMSSVAAIPVTGWAMAPGVGAEAFATGMGYMGSIASAAKGWDIPAGLNPMAQLHEREMVLPAEHADTIRSMGKGGGGTQIHLNISTMDARSFKRALSDNKGGLVDVLHEAARNGRISR